MDSCALPIDCRLSWRMHRTFVEGSLRPFGVLTSLILESSWTTWAVALRGALSAWSIGGELPSCLDAADTALGTVNSGAEASTIINGPWSFGSVVLPCDVGPYRANASSDIPDCEMPKVTIYCD